MRTEVIDLAKDFSRYPAGRFKSDGQFSGQAFRERFLEPALAKRGKPFVVKIKLDGALGYGSSFLDEAFAGLIRSTDLSADDFFKTFNFETNNKSLILLIEKYVREAEQVRVNKKNDRPIGRESTND